MTKYAWLCNDDVSVEYFGGKKSECNKFELQMKIAGIIRDYPGYHIYVGMTHHPCGRWRGSYQKESLILPSNMMERFFYLDMGWDELITERRHMDDFDKMFVICYVESEAAVRGSEQLAIEVARKDFDSNVINKTKGGNGRLAKDKPYYFIYVCITKNTLLTEAQILTPIV